MWKLLKANNGNIFKCNEILPFQSATNLAMKSMLILAVLFCSTLVQETVEGSCWDDTTECVPHMCYGMWLGACKKTCNDCDGAKFKKFREIYRSKICADAYPLEVCRRWKRIAEGEDGCDGHDNGLTKGCRKTCNLCR